MGKKSKPAAPAVPDYAAAAKEQGTANLDAARIGAELTNSNQITPYGNQMFTKDPNSDQWTSTITLSPEQQNLYNLQTQGQTALGEKAVGMLGDINNSPLDTSGLPDRVNTLGSSNYSLYQGNTGAPVKSLDFSQFSNPLTAGSYDKYAGPTGAAVDSLDFSGLDRVPGASDFASQGTDVRDALYRQATSRLDPEYAQRENALRTRLLNSGVAEGSEAYNNSMNDFARQRQADYGDARDRSILASGNEQSRLNSDALASRAQMLSQILQGGSFANSARQQGVSNAMSATNQNNAAESQKFNDTVSSREQMLNQILTGGTFANNASQADIDNAIRALGFNNSAEAARFADQLTAGNFQNQQRGAGLDEASYLADRPLNMYNALSTGAQVTNPTFRGTGQVQGPAAAPVFAGAQAQGQSAMDLYNAQMAARNSAMGGLSSILGSGLGMATGGMFGAGGMFGK